jgi:WD40 repeat protein
MGKEKHVLNGHTNSVNSVAFSTDGSRIVSGSDDNSVQVWDALMGEEKHVLNSHIISGSRHESVQMWDALTGEGKHVLNSYTNSVNSVAFSSNGGSCVVSGSHDKSVQVWGKSMQHRASRYTREEVAKPTHGLEFTGWLLSPCGGEYIMFIPPGERLPDDANILTIPHSFISYVDFTKSRLGPEWGSCYFP